jgi:hypothetical protein
MTEYSKKERAFLIKDWLYSLNRERKEIEEHFLTGGYKAAIDFKKDVELTFATLNALQEIDSSEGFLLLDKIMKGGHLIELNSLYLNFIGKHPELEEKIFPIKGYILKKFKEEIQTFINLIDRAQNFKSAKVEFLSETTCWRLEDYRKRLKKLEEKENPQFHIEELSGLKLAFYNTVYKCINHRFDVEPAGS